MKFLLITPLAEKSLLGKDFYFRLPPLGPLRVAALTPPDWEVKIIDEKVETLDLEQDADLVGITVMTPAANRAYKIARSFRERGIKVIMGGMHASNVPDEASQHCDSIFIGEAEDIWEGALEDFKKGQLKKVYKRQNGYPSIACRPLSNWNHYEGKGYLPVHFIETTRGCPHNCDFCSVTNIFGGKFRLRPVDEVEQEIKGLKPFEGRFILKNVVFFVDDNIYGNKRHTKELLKRIMPYSLKWLGQASMNIANNDEILSLCKKSGCMGLAIGFETLSSGNLKDVKKSVNNPQNYIEAIKKMHDYGIGISGNFMFGFDEDDEGVFDRTLEFVLKAKLDSCYFSIVTPYPGTKYYTKLLKEGRLIDNDWSNYNTNHVVHKPKLMSPEKLLEGFNYALKECWSCSSIIKRLWGNGTYKNYWYPMNFGFKRSIHNLIK